MSSIFYDYEIDQQPAKISEDSLSAYAVLSKAAIPGSVKIVVDDIDLAYETSYGLLFDIPRSLTRDATNELSAVGRNTVDYTTREVFLSFQKPVRKVMVQYFYVPREDEIKS